MANVMNTVFGIGIAILIFIVALLGIDVFYPRPDVADFNCSDLRAEKVAPCAKNLTLAECESYMNTEIMSMDNSEYEECWDRYDGARDKYDNYFFLITTVLGFIAIISSMFLFDMVNIAAGTAFSGLALIVFGFMVGWQSTNEVIKFIISLIVTSVVVTFAVIVNRRYDSKPVKKK